MFDGVFVAFALNDTREGLTAGLHEEIGDEVIDNDLVMFEDRDGNIIVLVCVDDGVPDVVTVRDTDGTARVKDAEEEASADLEFVGVAGGEGVNDVVAVLVADLVSAFDALIVLVRDSVSEAVLVGEPVAVVVDEGEELGRLAVLDGVCETDGVVDGVCVRVRVCVCVCVGVGVRVGDCEPENVAVLLGVGVGDAEKLGVSVGVAVCVGVGEIRVGVSVGVKDCAEANAAAATAKMSVRIRLLVR